MSFTDFVVWRWIQPTLEGPKVWQGQAFGESSSAGVRSRHRSSIPVAPLTTCLKIRNMFDLSVESGVQWHKPVEDAVLDKCFGAAIVHIAVDATSTDGCVYVRLVLYH
jgi:inner nuclear membrane protein Man1